MRSDKKIKRNDAAKEKENILQDTKKIISPNFFFGKKRRNFDWKYWSLFKKNGFAFRLHPIGLDCCKHERFICVAVACSHLTDPVLSSCNRSPVVWRKESTGHFYSPVRFGNQRSFTDVWAYDRSLTDINGLLPAMAVQDRSLYGTGFNGQWPIIQL